MHTPFQIPKHFYMNWDLQSFMATRWRDGHYGTYFTCNGKRDSIKAMCK